MQELFVLLNAPPLYGLSADSKCIILYIKLPVITPQNILSPAPYVSVLVDIEFMKGDFELMRLHIR
jgi:hypothetical protein